MRRDPRPWLFLAVLASLSGCMTAARVFLDLPEESARQREQRQQAEVSMEMLDSIIRALQEGPELPPPPIEDVLATDSLLALLPVDRAGAVDWVRARDDGVIRPRASRPGTPADSSAIFPFDIYLSARNGPQAYFPHSTHQSWVGCQSCHPRMYGGDLEGRTADEIHGPESCGSCHSGIAFPIESCERCHAAALDLPARRLTPSLGRSMQLVRADPELQDDGNSGRFTAAAHNYPPATFPHGTHRIRFQCRACHERPFAMERGGTRLTQNQAHNGEGCGMCHNGRVAFDTGMDDCNRCHLEPALEPTGVR